MKRKVCRKCKRFYEGEVCPVCKENKVANSWQGRIFILDSSKSLIAKKIGITINGEYAIRIR